MYLSGSKRIYVVATLQTRTVWSLLAETSEASSGRKRTDDIVCS